MSKWKIALLFAVGVVINVGFPMVATYAVLSAIRGRSS